MTNSQNLLCGFLIFFFIEVETGEPKSSEKITEWWKEMSAMKPIHCNVPNTWDNIAGFKRSHLFAEIVPILSYPCEQLSDESSVPYKYHGKLNGHLFHGPGKVLLSGEGLTTSDQTCLRVNFLHYQRPRQVLGNFTNGYLDGHAKAILQNNHTVISQFKNGLANGLRRVWDADGNLISVGLYVDGFRVGKCFSKMGKYIIFLNCSTFDNDKTDHVAIKVDSDGSTEAFIGKSQIFASSLERARKVSLISVEKMTDSCLIDIQFKASEEIDNQKYYLDLFFDEFIGKPPGPETLCNISRLPNVSDSDNLVNWASFTHEKYLDKKIHHLFWLMMPEKDPPAKSAKKFVSDIQLDLNPDSCDPLKNKQNIKINFMDDEEQEAKILIMSLDTQNRPHGFFEIEIIKTRLVKFGLDLRGVYMISGTFNHGKIEGPTVVRFMDNRLGLLTFQDGVLHGPAMIVGVHPLLPNRNYKEIDGGGSVSLTGRFSNGIPTGDFWIQMIGGGFLHGKFEENTGKVTGDKLAFIYPDMETALVGKFTNFEMISAEEAEVAGVKCNDYGLQVVSEFDLKGGPKFYYEPGSNSSFGGGKGFEGVQDPYEKKWLKLAPSSVPNSGMGVFVRRDVPAFRTISLYAGYLFKRGEESDIYATFCTHNVSRSPDERRHCKKYSLPLKSCDTIINIPPECDGPDGWHPTLGQKINHHFYKNQTKYSEMEHPRWGLIAMAQTAKAVKAGEELFSFYGYKRNPFPEDFPWYFELENLMQEEIELERKKKSKA